MMDYVDERKMKLGRWSKIWSKENKKLDRGRTTKGEIESRDGPGTENIQGQQEPWSGHGHWQVLEVEDVPEVCSLSYQG